MTELLNAWGYVVVKPSVELEIGYPGEAWLKGVTVAANKLIKMGSPTRPVSACMARVTADTPPTS